MAARSVGTVTLSFGLVSMPIKIYNAEERSTSISFRQINPDTGARVRQQLVDESTGEEVQRSSLVKGYEVRKDEYLILTEEEVASAAVEASKAIDIQEFVELGDVDWNYFERPYYLAPDKGGQRPYAMLRAALWETGLGAIGQYCTRGKQYLVFIRADQTGLVMHQLRYAAATRSWDDIPLGKIPEPVPGEVELATQLIGMHKSVGFEVEKYRDVVQERLQEIIDAKSEGRTFMVKSVPAAEPTLDLMAALKASLGGA